MALPVDADDSAAVAGDSDDEIFLAAYGAHRFLTSQLYSMQNDTSSEDEEEGEDMTLVSLLQEDLRPGKGVSLHGEKAQYVRNKTHYYEMCRTHHNTSIFDRACGVTREEFDRLHDLCKANLCLRMDPRLDLTPEQVSQPGRVTSRALSTKEQLFLFLVMLRGSNEGSLGLNVLERDFGVSRGTISNTFYHVLGGLYSSLKRVSPPLISWPTSAERRSMRGLINGFPHVVAFVDGSKVRAWRPVDEVEQEYIFDGHHHFHAYTVLFWCDIYGQCIRLDFTLKGSMQDRGMFNMTAVGRRPDNFLSRDSSGEFIETILADSGFHGDGPIETPHKKGQAVEFRDKHARNRDIRKQRICNEWGIGRVNNKFRLFLGRWSQSKQWFPMSFEAAAMIIAYNDRASGNVLVPLSRLLERQQRYKETGGLTW